MVISDRYSKLTRTVPLKNVSAETVAQAFVSHWVFVYGAPVKLLYDNGSQFTSRVFLAVCKFLRVESVFITAYHPQANGQVERFNCTLVSSLRHYLADNQRDWDQFTDALTYGYNCTVNRMIGMKPFDLILSRTPSPLSIQQTPALEPDVSRAQYMLRFLTWLRGLMSTARDKLLTGPDRYKRDFDERLRMPTPQYPVGDQVLIERETSLRVYAEGSIDEKTNKDRVNNKLAPRTEGSFPVVALDEHTVTIIRTTGLKDRVSGDRIVKAPPLWTELAEPTPPEVTVPVDVDAELTPPTATEDDTSTPSPPG